MGVADDEVTNGSMVGGLNFWADYRELPPALVRYLVVVSVAGPVAAILWLLLAPEFSRPDRWLVAAILTIFACLAERFPIHLTHKTYVNVASAVYVAMLLTMPLQLCGVAALVAAFSAALLRWRSNSNPGIAEALFNVGQTALYVTAASICVFVVDQLTSPSGAGRHLPLSDFPLPTSPDSGEEHPPTWGRGPSPLGGVSPSIGDIPIAQVVVASIALHLFNSLLVATATARHLGIRSTRVWRENLLLDIGPHGGMTVVGLSAAQLGLAAPLLIPTLAIPAVLIHRAAMGSVQLRQNVRHALESLMEVVEIRDPYTAGHSRRVAQIARAIALELGLTAEEADRIEAAGNLHDLGKVAIDPAILQKPGKLTESEWAEMKRHPGYGAAVLNRFESYKEGVDLIRGHHEAWDGSGYPDGLRGVEIPLGARILAVADSYDALTSDRPYRKGMDHQKAVSILRDGAGSQWDATVVAAFTRLDVEQFKEDEPVVLAQPEEQAAVA